MSGSGSVSWGSVSLGSLFAASGANQTLAFTELFYGGSTPGQVRLNLLLANDRFTPAFEATGRIIFEASDGETLEVMIADADMSEPYEWVPTNSSEVIAFANHVRGLSNNNATLTLTDDPTTTAPGTPAAPTLTVNSQTQITAVGVVPDDGGTTISSYDWRYKKTADAGWTDRLDETNLTQVFTGLDAGTEYEVQFRATNSEGDSDYSPSATATTDAAPATVLASFGVEAGDPTLEISARVIAPAAPISASFSANAGDPLLTINARVIPPAVPTTSVTVPLTGESVFDDYIRWSDNYSLGSLFDANGEEQELSLVDLNNANPPGRVRISITGTNNRFTPEFEASGRFTFTASDGESVTVMLANADMTEIYQWTPANSAEVTAFVLHVKGLADQTGTITLTGEGTAAASGISVL